MCVILPNLLLNQADLQTPKREFTMLKQRSSDTQIENYPFRSEIELNIDFDTGKSPALNSNVLAKSGLKILNNLK